MCILRDLVRLRELRFSATANFSEEVIPILPSLGRSSSNALLSSLMVGGLSRKVFLIVISSGLRKGLMPGIVHMTKFH